jgi:hypothetical protein
LDIFDDGFCCWFLLCISCDAVTRLVFGECFESWWCCWAVL